MSARKSFAATAVLMLALWPVHTRAQDLSATTINHQLSGKSERGKLYVSNGRVRMEVESFGPGGPTALLYDPARQTTYSLSVRQKVYTELPSIAAIVRLGPFAVLSGGRCPSPAPRGIVCRSLGKESVNGRAVEKFEVGETTAGGRSVTGYAWVDPQLRVAIKWQMGPTTGELENVRTGAQPAELFAVPPDYRWMGQSSQPQP